MEDTGGPLGTERPTSSTRERPTPQGKPVGGDAFEDDLERARAERQDPGRQAAAGPQERTAPRHSTETGPETPSTEPAAPPEVQTAAPGPVREGPHGSEAAADHAPAPITPSPLVEALAPVSPQPITPAPIPSSEVQAPGPQGAPLDAPAAQAPGSTQERPAAPAGALDAAGRSAEPEAAAEPAALPELPVEPAGATRREGAAPGSPQATTSIASEAQRAPQAAPQAQPAATPAEAQPTLEQADAVLRQIKLQVTPELRQATIQLEPASLGRLSIRIEVGRERVRAEVSVENAGTLAALERHAPELRAALAAGGLGEAELHLSLAQEGEGFDGHAHGRGRARPGRAANPAQDDPPAALRAALATSLVSEDHVDTYA